MKILSWNMAGAGFHKARTHGQAWDWLLQRADFDVAMLQEAIPPPGIEDVFKSAIFQARYPDRSLAWGNCILSRSQSFEHFVPSIEAPWASSVTGPALVAKPVDSDLWLVNIHSNANPITAFDHTNFESVGGLRCHSQKLWEVEVIAHHLRPLLSDKRFVFGGDLNSALLLDDVYRYSNNKILWDNLRQQGYHDLRHAHSPTEQQTFFRKNTREYQLDHLFSDLDTQLTSTSWRVLTEVASELQLSDHAPVIVEI